ncbi:PP2C family protein-serine/threonine phosphatase [Acanthopleuribacter pedis]|uniref:Protein phosphatase 2C domain-containing protein n=1 Tax=Acanthopleuribacter pedis TaxID=442870 RepID=A0A8J7QFI7_9BACT|nr:protein phosphatase 2C domain-containing protein [Acanthopleuribacter pedis]MBO1323409.1 protein phosphatase 2C domain-containing protein [Acanthopleuribacter pedis]
MFQLLLPKRKNSRLTKLTIETASSLCTAEKKTKSSDVPFLSQVPPFFMLADGEGQEDHGELAAALATRYMQKCLEDAWSDDYQWRWPLNWGTPPENVNADAPEILLNHARNLTHEYLLQFKSKHKKWSDISAALTTAFIVGNTLYASHTGSNRIYLSRKKDFQCISTEASGAMLGDAQSHIDSLENADKRKPPFLLKKRLVHGDRILLCTKGISALTNQEIHAVIAEKGLSADETADSLIKAVRAKKPPEDTAVVVVLVARGGGR